MSFDFKIRIKNIGPLKNVDYQDNFSTNKTVIYAKNGSGKSFFSKALQKIASNDTSAHDKLISFGQARSSFELTIDQQVTQINLIRGQSSTISNPKYIFHVFNSDYVKDNIEKRGYSPLDKNSRSGYILGKERIDLSKEKKRISRVGC